ncbi:hypothetical protein [Priestia megaterium]|uniref:hypothetical protein n=1 Tax=Priestia megaterium TaxID=1404 RepID=UPI000CA10E73|nr:hypothetical protein [Priestia megaterium]AUO14763.1 hypothetical protein C0569_26105 [Priestia megaterium]
MKPVQTEDIQMLLYTLAKDTDIQQLRYAAADMIERLEEEKKQKEQAVYYAVLDEISQSNIKVADYEKNSLKEENGALKQLLKDTVQLL